MDPNSLIVHQVERGRLCLVMDAVSKIYGVRINTDAVDTCSKQSKTSETNNTSCSRSEATAVGKLQNERRQAAWNTCKDSSCRPGEALPPVSLLFEADVSRENIEKAKNFVRTHLEPGADYVTCAHKLENLQEFNMVLENSQDIQTSTNALLTFNPDCLEVTLQGSQNSIATARSKVVVFLEKLREQACSDTNSTESSESQGKTHHFYDDLLLDNFIENNNVPSELSHSLTGSGTEDIAKSSQRGQVKASDSDTGISRNQHSGVDGKKMQSDLHDLVPVVDSFDDIECDDAKSPESDVSLSPVFQHVCGLGPDQFVKMSVIASDDEGSCEETILTEPKYSKKVEQALKLGYTEKHVTKVLARLGPECSLNDMLSELIKLGALDSDPLSGQSLSPEPDVTVAYDIVDFGPHKGHKYSTVNLGAGDSSSADANRSIPADPSDSSNLRDIIIDGSNVAMSHGKKVFSCKGIQLAVSWFRERGHKNITAFVPQWRKETSRPDAPITDQEILSDLEKEGVVVFTPARRVKGRRVVCYDDRYILKLAVVTDGIVVSNDVYRDLVNEKEDFRKVVEQRLLMYSFVSDRFMPPEDPLGRFGPTLDNFLRKIPVEPVPRPQDCPYGKKCTYGNKCRFFHPERGFAPQKSVTETLKEQAELKLQERATRLSEIAEKSRRSKQKLSRTKSLIPWDPVICPFAVDEAKNKSEKPKLSHSKSVVYPSKSSDYLNEHRKKLEEAELTAAMEKISARDSASEKQVPQQGFFHNTPDKQCKPKSHSPSSSPVPQKDILKQMTTGENLPRNTSPLKSVSTNSPSHVTMKKAESPEGYLTGHLYVAKKLSDEGCESSFFSEHSCSPSSTRTSSPVSSAGRITEQKQFLLDAIHKDRQDDISGSFSLPPPFHPALFHHQPPTSAPQTGHHDSENIPNLSIFENELCRDSQRFVGSDLAGHRHISMTATHLPDYLPYKADPCSPDSGLFTSYESLCSPYHNVSEDPLQQFKGYPGSVVEKPHSVPEHMNLRRAFSSTGNIKTSEISHQKLGRWASGFPAVYFGEELPGVKPEQSVPVLDKSSVHMQGHPHGMNRQNSSSDPQIHNITAAADMQDMLSPLFSPLDSARSFQDPFSSHNRQYQVQQLQQKQFENHNQLQRMHMQQQPNNLLLSPQLPKPSTDVWGEPVSHPNLRHRSSLGGATQSQYSQLQNPASYHSTVYQGHLVSHAGTQNVMAASTYNPSAPNLSQPPPTYHQPAMMYAAQFGPPPPGIYLDARRQSFPSPGGYSPHQVPKGQAFGCPDQHQNVSLIQPASLLIIPPEDAPILPDDPRYLNYYRLKDLFGEPVVRRVMNLNRGELSLDRICNLIIKYKEETGGL